jgi:hypothetical protein
MALLCQSTPFSTLVSKDQSSLFIKCSSGGTGEKFIDLAKQSSDVRHAEVFIQFFTILPYLVEHENPGLS